MEEYYKSIGIESTDDVDFSASQLLIDGRSIKLVMDYTLNTESLTFGMVKAKLHFRQAAVTAAWVKPDNEHTLELDQLYK